jgi:hypothetical protein
VADRVDLEAVQDRLTTVQGRLKAHYFADPDDCVWAVEQVAALLAEVRVFRDQEATDARSS